MEHKGPQQGEKVKKGKGPRAAGDRVQPVKGKGEKAKKAKK